MPGGTSAAGDGGSALARALLRPCDKAEAKLQSSTPSSDDASSDLLERLRSFFNDGGKLEKFVRNPGQVSLVAQTAELSALVIVWPEADALQYGHQHSCAEVCTWVQSGSVRVESVGCSDVVVEAGQAHRLGPEAKSHMFRGALGSVSVHVYRTPVANMVCHPIQCKCTNNPKLVLCQGVYSVTDAERGASVARVCAQEHEGAHVCNQSLRLYTNFRDLIELLHHEIAPLADGEVHSPSHIEKITGLLGAVRINEAEYSRYLRFKDDAYTRNLVGYDVPSSADGKHKAKFTVLILCWDKGQMSPIHDHAGSSCWVKVLQGQVREIRYDASVSPPRVKRDVTLGAQQTCYINDTQGVHSMGNPNPDQVAVSLHVYAPPYILCKLFDEASGETKVGSMATARIPSNPFPFLEASTPSVTALDEHAARIDGAAATPPSAAIQLSDFYSQVGAMVSQDRCHEVGPLLSRLALKEHEWKEFVHFDSYRYTRSLVALEASFSLMVLCWNSGQGTPIHSHGPNVCSWVKVLRGSMVLKRYDGTPANPTLVDSTTYHEGASIECGEFKGIHVLQNASPDEPAVTLHLYSPPFVQMAYLDSAGVDRVIPVVHSATSTNRCCTADPISLCDRVIERQRSVRSGSFESDEDGASSSSSTAAHTDPEDDHHDHLGHGLAQAEAGSDETSPDNLLSFFEQEQDRQVFTNINALARFVTIRGLSGRLACQQVLRALDRMNINPEEWAEFISSDGATDSIIARGPDFSILVRRFDAHTKTQRSVPEHSSWLKVLEGEVMEAQYLGEHQIHASTISKTAAIYLSNRLSSTFRNVTDTPCYALQIIVEDS